MIAEVSMPDKDVTNEVGYGGIDGETIEVRRCACGAEFDSWDFILGLYRDLAHPCPKCGRRFYFKYKVTVLEVS